MKVLDQDGRELRISFSGSDIDDIQIDKAEYMDSDEEVSEEALEYIMRKYNTQINDEWYQRQVMKAEAYWEDDR